MGGSQQVHVDRHGAAAARDLCLVERRAMRFAKLDIAEDVARHGVLDHDVGDGERGLDDGEHVAKQEEQRDHREDVHADGDTRKYGSSAGMHGQAQSGGTRI